MVIASKLSNIAIDLIANLPEVIQAREQIDTQSSGSVYFNIELTDSLKNHLDISLSKLSSIPMRWIKGDTKPHVDKGTKSFDSTYLAYLTDSPGELIVDGEPYPIHKGCGYAFSEGIRHETVGTGAEPRLLLGPMSEAGFAVGAAPIIEPERPLPVRRGPMYTNNAMVFYKAGSLASGGVGTVRNSRAISRRV